MRQYHHSSLQPTEPKDEQTVIRGEAAPELQVEAATITDLPNEILERILQFCNSQEIQNVEKVNNRLRTVCSSAHVWRHRFFADFGIKCRYIAQEIIMSEKTALSGPLDVNGKPIIKIEYRTYYNLAKKQCNEKQKRYESRTKNVSWQEYQNWAQFSVDQLPK